MSNGTHTAAPGIDSWADIPPRTDPADVKIPFGDLPNQWVTAPIAEGILVQLFAKHRKMFGDYLINAYAGEVK